MRRHRGEGAGAARHRSRREELTALRHDLRFAIGVLSDVVRGRPFS